MRHRTVIGAATRVRSVGQRGLVPLALAGCLVVGGSIYAADPSSENAERMNAAIEQLADDEPAIGIFSLNRGMLNADALGRSPLDFVVVDTEHHPFDPAAVRQVIRNMRSPAGFRAAPLVRITAEGGSIRENQWMVKQALDAGAFGLMVPHVDSAEEAREAVRAMRYPPEKETAQPKPHGRRGWAPFTAARTWDLPVDQYTAKADLWPLDPEGELLLVVQIEKKKAIDNLDAILDVPGVGAAFIGPADLHADMGYAGEIVDEPRAEVEEQIARAARIAEDHETPVGIAANAGNIEKRLDQGFSFITVGIDVGLTHGVGKALEKIGRKSSVAAPQP